MNGRANTRHASAATVSVAIPVTGRLKHPLDGLPAAVLGPRRGFVHPFSHRLDKAAGKQAQRPWLVD
jgi:hypothetical protein